MIHSFGHSDPRTFMSTKSSAGSRSYKQFYLHNVLATLNKKIPKHKTMSCFLVQQLTLQILKQCVYLLKYLMSVILLCILQMPIKISDMVSFYSPPLLLIPCLKSVVMIMLHGKSTKLLQVNKKCTRHF